MKLRINGTYHELEPIADFRARYGLPNSFGVAYFEPKDEAGLGTMDNASTALQTLRQNLLQYVPESIPLMRIIPTVDYLTEQFHRALITANEDVGLRAAEIDFAVSGFRDIVHGAAYALLIHTREPDTYPYDFDTVYQEWVDASTRVSTQTHTYSHGARHFAIHVLNNPYGRVGLMVTHQDITTYLSDPTLSCPAGSYMYQLTRQVAEVFARNIQTSR